MNDKQRLKRLERAQIRVLFHTPFFAASVARLPVIWDSTIETACTDGDCIRWNPDWFDALDDAVLVTVLCHEACHCLLGHLWRLPPPGGDVGLANEASDHAVNLMLKEFGEQVTARNLADPFPFPKDKPPLADPRYKGMSEEAIYAALANQPKSPQPKNPGSPGAPAGAGGAGSGQPHNSGAPAPGSSKGKPAPSGQNCTSFGQFSKPVKDAAGQKHDQSSWQGTLIQSLAASKGRGHVPGRLARFVDDLLSPKVPWVELLKNFLREQAQDDWDFMRPNRMYGDCEFILPSLNSERMGAVVFAVDTSGSIDHDLLKVFKSEMQGCLDDLKPSKVLELCCDTRITSEKEYRQGEQVGMEAPGGGGTSFVPVFKRLDELPTAPKCVVYLTDLDGAFPKTEPAYPVLWVVYGGKDKAPFGEVVKVD